MNRIKKTLFAAFAFILFSSCVGDEKNRPNDLLKNEYSIGLTLAIQGPTSMKRAVLRSSETGKPLRMQGYEPGDQDSGSYLTDPNILNENEIVRLNVFIFSNDGNLILGYKDADVMRQDVNASTTTGEYKAILRIPQDKVSMIEHKPVKMVVIANPLADIMGFSTIETLQKKVETYTELNVTETPQTSFLMDGTIEVNNITWGAAKSFKLATPIKLKRALAKIRLRIAEIAVRDYQNGIETPYEVVEEKISVKLVHYTQSTSLTNTVPYILPADQWKESAYRPMKLLFFPGKTNPKETEGRFYGSFPFYAGECKWHPGDSKQETHLIVKIKLRPTYHTPGDTGIDYYYRIPINYRKAMDGVEEERLHKIERNYLYDVVTTIEQLGSLDEGTSLPIESNIAIQPWPEKPDEVDGTVTDAHYLVVKEREPIMANIDTYTIDYISSLPVKIEITKAYYEYYDKFGDYYKVVFSSTDNTYKFYKDKEETIGVPSAKIEEAGLTLPDKPNGTNDDASVFWTVDKFLQGGNLTVSHKIPNNFVPFRIDLLVTQLNTSKPLTETVHITQYPSIFVTGEKSPGFTGGTSMIWDGSQYKVPINPDEIPDFRFHTSYGSPYNYQGKESLKPQRNNVFNRVTTKVPAGEDFFIGNPVDQDQYTKTDPISSKLVSPEFIIATQYGMSKRIPQKRSVPEGPSYEHIDFPVGFGPYARNLFKSAFPYKETDPGSTYYNIYRSYSNAENRCYNYFEGEYGTDGDYEEAYRYNDENATWRYRTVKKTFKYQGRWRVPTVAEARLIDQIQDNPKSVTKYLMYGEAYWTAQDGTAYNFVGNQEQSGWPYSEKNAGIRCIFDTYMHNDKKK